MITNFEKVTSELTLDELMMVDHVIRGLKLRSKDNPIKAPEICESINNKAIKFDLQFKFTQVRLRKIINYIRSNSLLPVIATSEGYYISYEKEDIEKQVKSLYERAASIVSCADGLKRMI